MPTVVSTDYSVASNGDIRYTGTGTNNTVIEFHRWLGDLMDNAAAVGNDLLDITSSTASARSTDNIITLNYPYNIDDTLAQHLYDGSVVQSTTSANLGENIYDGLLVLAPANTYVSIIQNGKIITPNFWTTALNADSANGISHKFMVKVRSAGTDIDGRRIVVQNREFGKNYSEFKINGTARGNNVAALSAATDLNNATAVATIKALTTISNTEGYQLIDVDGNSVTEPYYSKWLRTTSSINTLYERTKWLSRRATSEASGTDTGTAFQLANATIIGQAQSFANGVVASYVTRAFFTVRKVGSPTGSLNAKVYAHSGTFGSSSIPTGSALATSVNVDGATLTTVYQTVEFGFNTQTLLTASTNYVVSLEHAVIDASNYWEVQGLATSGTASGNRSQLVASTWTATAGDDLTFQVDTSPQLYKITGEIFRGVTHEIPVGLVASTGTFLAVEPVSWGSGATAGTGQLLAIDSTTASRFAWMQLLTGVAPAAALAITGGTSAAVATTNNNTIATTAATSSAGTATITFAAQAVTPFPSGTTITVAGVTPTGFNGTFVSTGGSTTTVTYLNSTAGPQTVAGTVQGIVVERTLSFPYFGASTGSAMIGAYGLGVTASELTASDKLTDLTNTLRVPPNNVTFTVSGLGVGTTLATTAASGSAGTATITFATQSTVLYSVGSAVIVAGVTPTGYNGTFQVTAATTSTVSYVNATTGAQTVAGTIQGAMDRVMVGPALAGALDTAQRTLSTTLNSATTTAVVVTVSIPTDTPTTGNIRIQLDTGIYRLQAYTSYTGSTFTIASTDYSGVNVATAPRNVFISYIDTNATTASISFTGVYSADRTLFIRVRNGGTVPIKTFETTGTLGSAGGSSTAIRTSDA